MSSPNQKRIDARPYLRAPFSRCNCWRMVQKVFADQGVALPDYAISAADAKAISGCVEFARSRWQRIDTPVAPCVVLMRNDAGDPGLCNHFGIYLGDNRVLHTLKKSGPAVFKLDHPWWAPRIEGFYVPSR